jgi:polysaccharide deacetylase family protein (PEP-CTERM system associated)
MINALTIDVEDYFQVNAFAQCIDRAAWDSIPCRVVDNTNRCLDLLDQHGLKATFFVLGWIAERNPELVLRIQARGHEIASHGYGHQLVYDIGPDAFREDIRRSKRLLEDITGMPVLGYRAPSYSITGTSLWAFDILVEEGFRYDSSVFPVVHDVYGIPEAQRFPHVIEGASGNLQEFPMSTYEFILFGNKRRLGIAGGGYLRLLPVRFIEKSMRMINETHNQPAVLYFHPWEIDPEQPKIKASLKSRFRHYTNLHKTEQKLGHLFSKFSFAPMSSALKGEGGE